MSPNPPSIRLLHIGSDHDDASMIRPTLSRIDTQSFSVTHKQTFSAALDCLEEHENNDSPFSIIILDMCLPDVSSVDAVKRLQSRHSGQAIIVLSALSDETEAVRAVELGAQDYLLKDDFNPDTVARAIRYSINKHKQDKQVSHLENFDALTGLPNRTCFNEYLEYAIQNWKNRNDALTILFIDCDRFKLINDTHGHKIGDEFLQATAYDIKNSLRSSDFVARLGNNEFAIILDRENNNVRSPTIVGEKIRKKIAQGITLKNGLHIDASCSIGIANYDGNNKKSLLAEKLMHEADTAMSSAKNKGGNCIYFFDSDLKSQAERRTHLLRHIISAYRQEEFSLHYQPIIHTSKGICVGIEALLRWVRPNGESIPPDEFIPLLEETGIIKTVGDWVMRRASEDFVQIKKKKLLPDDAWISVNVSPIQFSDQNFVFRVKNIVKETQMCANSLHIEITESLLVNQGNRSIQRMRELNELGVKLSIDDFGTGYSSMKYLKDLPINCLKIDKSFILQSLDYPEDNALSLIHI